MNPEQAIKSGIRNIEVATRTGLSIDQVKRLRKKLGLSRVRRKLEPSREEVARYDLINKLMNKATEQHT